MAQYKVLTKKLIEKEAVFIDEINNEARSGWKVISVGYNKRGQISKVFLEKSKY